MISKKINKCRVSKSKLKILWDLGVIKLSHFTKNKEINLAEAPLRMAVGLKGKLLQLADTTNRDQLYRQYWYASGTNQTMTNQLKNVVETAEKWSRLKNKDIVLDIGCNDGTLLDHFNKEIKIVKVGIDPAKNFAKIAKKKMHLHLCDYFTKKKFLKLTKNKKAKVITSIAMFYDLDDPSQFTKDVKESLTDDGVWILQMSYTPLMLMQNAFDNIIHEHLEYYSLTSIDYIMRKHNLKIVDVEFNDTNAGSIRLVVTKKKEKITKSALYNEHIGRLRYKSVLDYEKKNYRNIEKIFLNFKNRVNKEKTKTLQLLKKLKKQKKKVLGYGASTKGNTLLQYYGIDQTLISHIAERQSQKYGTYTPGSNIPIISEDKMRKNKPDYLFVLPWHFYKEFIFRERKLLEKGTKLIVPLPNLQIIGNK